MFNTIKTLIESRSSAHRFDTSRQLSDDDIVELVRLATLSPSAYNLQNWRFIAVRSDAAKARLKRVAHGQHKVMDASVTFIICGTLAAHEALPHLLQPSVEAGILHQSTVDGWAAAAHEAHSGNPELQRDEAFRSASLAAMTLMLAAHAMGLSTGAMSGFDAPGVVREFGLTATEVPVMLVTVGYAAPGNGPQKLRRSVHEVMQYV